MATLAPGVLLKLLECMKAGAGKPVGEHRSALLQVTDIVPVDLDEKDFVPKHGFYIKVSDSSRSIYVTLPHDQVDLVLSNKIQLGQFIYADRLDPGTPVPIIMGMKPLPGRHRLIGTPEPIVRVKSNGEKSDSRGVSRRRGSWAPEQNPSVGASSPLFVKPTTVGFEDDTPVKMSGRLGKEGSFRSSLSGALLSKLAEAKESSSNLMSKRNTAEKEPKIVQSLFSAEKSLHASPKVRGARAVESHELKNGNSHCLLMPGKLVLLQKEASKNRDLAQKVALQALRDASAAETLVRVLKIFSDMITTAKTELPFTCFDQYLSFHEEIMRATTDMEKIQAATSLEIEEEIIITDKLKENEDQCVLQEIHYNSTSLKKRGHEFRLNTVTKGKAFSPISFTEKKAADSVIAEGKNKQRHEFRLNTVTKGRAFSPIAFTEKKAADSVITEGKNKQTPCSLSSSIKLAKEVQVEAGNWFMEFLEAAVESGMKKKGEGKKSVKWPQSLILKLINWVESEQSGATKAPVDPRAAHLARKLRIKAKNP
ncbi:hypothetical protein AXF42_Ash012865 [Apostasia shenzhenica]|uniref:Uncharacterized protein n=1 Tax=Apostasia shenzhenica TaxID=1088818 RepID=A0A2I0AMN8_9ASPA|nr:hypothetical protein AXF42_Ash012865 [Apostasia shenzhenica]